MVNKIGILGGSGNIGSRCIDLLKKDNEVIATFKSNACSNIEHCRYIQLDINNIKEVFGFCKDVDILINCAGASYKNGENVARIACECNIPYIDPSGESFLEDKIRDISANGIFVLSSVYFPGLSGIIAKHICGQFDEVNSIEGYNVSEEIPSKSAVEDFVLTNVSGFGEALYSYENGKYVYDENVKYVNVKGKNYRLTNYITNEFTRIAKQFNVKRAYCRNQSYDKEIISKMQETIFKAHSANSDYKAEIEELISIFKGKISEEKFNQLIVTANGLSNGISKSIEIKATSKESNIMSAIICANTAKKILNNKLENGIYYAVDILRLDDVDSSNITMNVQDQTVEYDEGEI